MSVKSIKEDAFEEEVVKSELPVLIDFWAEWCGPCKEVSPILEEISTEMSDSIKIVKVNIDENPNIPNQYGVQSIPTLIIFKKGEVVAT
ncbi:MAG: Thioredoxin, partial [Alphaproteobacteria bacterium MarineAlpha6_Bin6]